MSEVIIDKQQILIRLNEELSKNTIENLLGWSEAANFDYPTTVGVAKSEAAKNKILLSDPKTITIFLLTPEGKEVFHRKATPEQLVWNALPEDGSFVKKEALAGHLTEKVVARTNEKPDEHTKRVAATLENGLQSLMKNKQVMRKKVEADLLFQRVEGAKMDDSETIGQLEKIVQKGDELSPEDKKNLQRRKWISASANKTFSIEKGPNFGKEATEVAIVTAEMLKKTKDGEAPWKNIALKPLNFDALGVPPARGHLHPLLKVREAFRQIFLELGYEEMQTDRFVESSFWNFDSLFQPQQHPARDAHDTFFIGQPAVARSIPEDLYKRVKEMHENGGHGSIGWRYKFSDEEPRKNVLRTHTTAVSSRTLYEAAQQKPFVPRKCFSIDRVYRNETLDATHLAEFHQIEGFIADRNITLASLMGAISEFYQRIGIKQLKFKPAYNPYTEPSMEIFGWHEERKTWMEIGNSGIFRPEMLLPLGLPEDVSVAAWGLSLERPTMIMYHYHNIRDLVGHKVDLEMIRKNPIPRF